MKRLSPLILIATIVLLAACGGQTGVSSGSSNGQGSAGTPAPSPTGGVLSVGTVGFGGDEPEPSPSLYLGNASAGVVLTNESRTLVAEQVKLQWTVYNSSGQVLDTTTTDLAVIRAGQALPVVAGFVRVKTTDIASAKVHSLVHFWRHDTNPKGVITGHNVTITPDSSSGAWKVTGEVNNGYSSTLERVRTYIYCVDGSGKFVAGTHSYVALLPANGTGSVTDTVYTTTAPASCQINGAPETIPPD